MEIDMNDLIPPYWTSPRWNIIGIDNIDKIILLGVNTIAQVIVAWEKEIEKYNKNINEIEKKKIDKLDASPNITFKKYHRKPKWLLRIDNELGNIRNKKTKAELIVTAFKILKVKAEKSEGADKKPCLSVCRPFDYFSIGESVNIFKGEQWINGIISGKYGCYNGQDCELLVIKYGDDLAFKMQILVRSSTILKPQELGYLKRHSDFSEMWVMAAKIFNEKIDSKKMFDSFSIQGGEKMNMLQVC